MQNTLGLAANAFQLQEVVGDQRSVSWSNRRHPLYAGVFVRYRQTPEPLLWASARFEQVLVVLIAAKRHHVLDVRLKLCKLLLDVGFFTNNALPFCFSGSAPCMRNHR